MGESEKVEEMLHENGRVNRLSEKQEEMKSKIEENALGRGKAQTEAAKSMQCDIRAVHEEELIFKNDQYQLQQGNV